MYTFWEPGSHNGNSGGEELMANTLIGSIKVTPATVRPGEPVLVEVCDLNGNPYAEGSGVTVSLQGVPIPSRYFQFTAPGAKQIVARAVQGFVAEWAHIDSRTAESSRFY
jgi:hypothetical protein